MIIDCHGHYTGAPAPLRAWRDRQLKAFEARSTFDAPIRITDDEIRETLEKSQVKAQRERGTDEREGDLRAVRDEADLGLRKRDVRIEHRAPGSPGGTQLPADAARRLGCSLV